jgi:CubicO group peptidase (beta-lactamase class C family)
MMKPISPKEIRLIDEWRIQEPESLGVNGKKLKELNQIIPKKYKHLNGIVIVKNGTCIMESYYNGFTNEDSHPVASVTKSVLSALIGIAIDKGMIGGIQEKVVDFFPEYKVGSNDLLKKSITIQHLLTMTAPIALQSSSRLGNEALDRLRRQKNWVDFILDQLGKKGRLGEFQYSTSAIHLLSAILTRITGKSAREFANECLFQPIGMRVVPDTEMKSYSLEDVFISNQNGWVKDPQGISTGGFGLSLTNRDMARFGLLYLRQGYWGKDRILSSRWVNDSIAFNKNQYGYLWWLKKHRDLFVYAALGSGGNMICCIPEKDLVVSITAKIISKPFDPWILVEEYVLPSLGHPKV